MMWFHRLADFLLRVILRILLKLTIRGAENTPATGSLIVAINHTSFLDPLLAGAFLPRTIMPLGKAELFETPVFGWIFPAYGAIPIDRNSIDRTAIRESLKLLRNDGALLVAPEGTRSDNGQLQRGRPGIALLAAHTDAAILPVAIWGVKHFWNSLRRLRRAEGYMAVGEPFRLAVDGRTVSREQLDEITDEIMYRLAELMPPEYRGVYADVEDVTARYLKEVIPVS